MKAEAFVSHLEAAKARLGPGYGETARYLKWAQGAMEKIKEAKAEYFFSKKAWWYVIELCEEIGQALREGGNKELVDVCLSIYGWALENENRIGGGGILSAVNSTLQSKDKGEIASWFEEKAVHADAESQFDLGIMFATGDSLPVDEEKAVYWFEQAAAKGHPGAQYNLGLMCLSGNGTPKNELKAVNWFEKAAAQGVVNAHLNLGRMYECGQGVSRNEQKAAQIYEKAALPGSRNAQFNLGVMYANGRGVPEGHFGAGV